MVVRALLSRLSCLNVEERGMRWTIKPQILLIVAMRFIMKNILLFAVLVMFASGCTTVRSLMPGQGSSSIGDQMLSQSQQTKSLGKKWNQGQELVAKGQKLLSKSQKLATESQQAKLEAEGLIAQGKSLISNSEEGYRVAFGEDVPSRETAMGDSFAR